MKNNDSGKRQLSYTQENTIFKRYNFSIFALIFLGVLCYVSISRINNCTGRLSELRTDSNDKAIIEEQIKYSSESWSEIARYARNLNRFFIYHRNFYTIPDEQKVTEADMAEDMAMLNSNLYANLTKATEEYNAIALSSESSAFEKRQAESDFHKNVDKLLEGYSDDVDLAKSARLRDRISNFFAIENYLDTTMEFTYYINDAVLNRSFSNIVYSSIDNYMENEIYIAIDISRIHDTFNGIPLSDGFAQNGISGFIMVPKDQPVGSVVQSGIDRALTVKSQQIRQAESQLTLYTAILAITVLFGILLILKSVSPNFSKAYGGFLLMFRQYLKMPFLVKLGVAAFSVLGMIRGVEWLSFSSTGIHFIGLAESLSRLGITYACVVLIIFAIYYVIYTFQGKHRLGREKEVIMAHKALYSLSIMRKTSPFLKPFIVVLMMITGAFFMFLGIFVLLSLWPQIEGVFFSSISFTLSVLLFAMTVIFSNYTKLSYYIKNMHEGNLITIPEENGLFSKPINMLNGLSEGLKVTLAEMVSAERTKSELITNVSHDLKTPLTSIINYVNLLKESDIENPNTKEYVNILEQKSERLRILIEDLFEAAKLSSRSMELSCEPVDVVQLLEQAIGELSEKLENKNIDVKFKSNSARIMLLLDGQRMWRVFENLLNNIANYSPAGSRAYINIEDKENVVEIVMKNISSFELDFNASELFERFKRGDSARTTEGSGLGLSISKDIVELHKGKMDIVIDGDLFKVVIVLNKI